MITPTFYPLNPFSLNFHVCVCVGVCVSGFLKLLLYTSYMVFMMWILFIPLHIARRIFLTAKSVHTYNNSIQREWEGGREGVEVMEGGREKGGREGGREEDVNSLSLPYMQTFPKECT